MEYRTGTEGIEEPARLRLVDPDGVDVWEPDPAVETEDVETLDELADLFIGEQGVCRAEGRAGPRAGHGEESGAAESFARPPEPESQGSMSLEAVITGHLPVRGTVWVRAYAASVARSVGEPVVLVRVTPDRTSVELVGSSAEADPVSDIGTAIRAAGCVASHWLLHFDELDQAGLPRAGLLDRVTVLSGADEPAIVSAYRLIKTLADGSDRERPLTRGDRDERIGVAIVGADPSNTTRATGRLVDATRQFLDLTLDVRPGVPRVQSASVTLLGDSDRRHEPAEVLSMITERPRERTTEQVHERARPGRVVVEDPAEPDVVGGVGDLPGPSALVDGLTPMGLPCPVAHSVEMATDNAGRLHLLSWWSPEAAGDLLKASAWARVNRPLLARVCGELNEEPGTPALHIVCEDLGVAADLRGTDAIVHLAQPAERATASGWVCGRVN